MTGRTPPIVLGAQQIARIRARLATLPEQQRWPFARRVVRRLSLRRHSPVVSDVALEVALEGTRHEMGIKR